MTHSHGRFDSICPSFAMCASYTQRHVLELSLLHIRSHCSQSQESFVCVCLVCVSECMCVFACLCSCVFTCVCHVPYTRSRTHMFFDCLCFIVDIAHCSLRRDCTRLKYSIAIWFQSLTHYMQEVGPTCAIYKKSEPHVLGVSLLHL